MVSDISILEAKMSIGSDNDYQDISSYGPTQL